ncbi:OmpA family protein [Limnohabitans sp.]|uniref:OmpA family protein n=1 Tax=Limnohabitans sp. TaxID=1907725 RepID=UPI0025B9972C|nr:OmpA family protein [Limnohabitans sp.]
MLLIVTVLALFAGEAWAQRDGVREDGAYLQSSQAGPNARIEVLGSTWRPLGPVSGDQSRILVYRPEAGSLSGATSVFVNGQYHTSLVPGAYSHVCYAPGDLEVGARQMKAGSQPKDQMDTITALSLRPAQTHYLRVVEQGGRPVLQPVAEAVALEHLQGLRLQVHTVSRVTRAQACSDLVAPALVTMPARQVALAADALFVFGLSDADAMLPEGRQSLDRLIEKLRNEYLQIERVHITGHADPLGSVSVNERLSQQRAVTVREYLVAQGLNAVGITSEGRGASEIVVHHCGSRATAAVIACNQPNRRVTIDVLGLTR